MEKAIKKYLPIFALPTFLAFTIGFIAPLYWEYTCHFVSLIQLRMLKL